MTPKGKRLYRENKLEEFNEYYHKTPKHLALEYITTPNSLTDEEIERLIHEAGRNELKILEKELSVDDHILKKIMERNLYKLSNGSQLFL